ncbi:MULTISPECIES: hypothetical protein [Haloarcula]|uniref:Uncharacterized protein n=1 Tax=Haloarcula pellucida TaxID=1427151 RepID=A0A830GI67_9EURY|nr:MULTISPECIES: hypothetical protein [Halomicroarcula]MBX0347650.1 hypothetical protein [Halomicroarcula pellucida]MDS0276416.1 hypothetical protein [Halomicroarcula sp. S1AR25-4]GGN89743.1 hypothetical protein GCM10009030_10760 [Halomicroarcula pellucida]
MAKFTLLELHLDGAEFTANAPGVGNGETAETAADESEASDSGGRGGVLALVVLLALVGVAVAGKKLLGGSDDEDLPSVDMDDE